MKLLNSKTYNGLDYDLNSIGPGGFVSREKFGLPNGFYGGRVDKIAYTKVPGLYMCMEGMEVIDLLVIEEELIEDMTVVGEEEEVQEEVVKKGLLDPEQFTAKELIDIATKMGKEVPSKATKAETVAIIGEVEYE